MSLVRVLWLCILVVAVALVAGCGDDSEPPTSSAPGSVEDCTAEKLATLEPGTLTIATDSPAYPPYFIDDDPTNGKGFESAVAFAIADKLGFTADDVNWVVVPFNASYAPGPKDFDFDVNQISITPRRSEQVDFSSPYYEASQAVVALKQTETAAATSLADVARARIGVQIGTTSLEAVEASIRPEQDVQVFDTSNDVVSALKQGQVDAVVVDVPTAFYLTAAQVPKAGIVGQFSAPGGDRWGALLERDSRLTGCVSLAVIALRASGELAAIEEEWMSAAADAPILE